MTNETAKRLRDSGFPHNWCSEDDCPCRSLDKNSVCFPTSDELIRELGDKFYALVLYPKGYSSQSKLGGIAGKVLNGFADPGEALAELYIATGTK